MKSCYLTLFLDRVDLEDISAQIPSLDIAVNLDMPPEQVRAMGQGKCYLMCQTMEPALQPHQGGELGLGNPQRCSFFSMNTNSTYKALQKKSFYRKGSAGGLLFFYFGKRS